MISNVSDLVTQFEDFLNSNEYGKAYELAKDNNLLFSHMNEQGNSCAFLLFSALQPYISINGHDIYSSLKDSTTKLLDYFLDKEPHYWYYKQKTDFSIYDDSIYIWPLTYMCFNNKEKIEYFFSNAKKELIPHGSLKSHYFIGRKIDTEMILLAENLLLPEKISIKDIVELKNSHPANFQQLLSIYENHRNNNKISYNHQTTIELFKSIFNIPDNELDYFNNTFQSLVMFFKPLLLKNYNNPNTFYATNSNTIDRNMKRQRYEDIFQNVLMDKSINTLYLIPALEFLQKEFPLTHIERYFKNNINFRFVPQLLSIGKDLEKRTYANIDYENSKLQDSSYIINKNKQYIFDICDKYFSTIFIRFLTTPDLFSKKEDISIINEKIEDYKVQFPEQFIKDWNDFKVGLELLELPLHSSDKDMDSYLQYLNLQHSIADKLDNNIRKKKI